MGGYMRKYAFGVDVGGTTVKMGIFTTQGELLEDWEIPTVTADGGGIILHDIAQAVAEKIREKDLNKDDIEGIGIGLPGPVLKDGTIAGASNLGWGVFNVPKKLRALTGLKVKAGNDADLAALGEMWKGGGAQSPDMVMVTLGTGVGGGVIIDGHIVVGRTGSTGEIGHMPIKDPEDEPESCGCGKHGCFQQYASASGALLIARRYFEKNPEVSSPLKKQGLTCRDIFEAAIAGDKAAIAITEKYYRILAKGLAVVSAVIDPERFVIGGGVSKAGNFLIEGIKRHYPEYAFHTTRDVQFVLAVLGNRAGMYGAVKLLIDR